MAICASRSQVHLVPQCGPSKFTQNTKKGIPRNIPQRLLVAQHSGCPGTIGKTFSTLVRNALELIDPSFFWGLLHSQKYLLHQPAFGMTVRSAVVHGGQASSVAQPVRVCTCLILAFCVRGTGASLPLAVYHEKKKRNGGRSQGTGDFGTPRKMQCQ